MSEGQKKAAKRLIKWRDSARRQLSSASCSDDLADALQFVLRNVAKTFKAALLSTDDDRREQLSRDLSTVLCQVSAHLYLRSRDLLVADCDDGSDRSSRSSRFDYWDHQCALLSYLLDLSLVRDEPAAITKICFVLSKSKHRVWDVLVQTWAICCSSAPVRLELQPRLLDVFRWFAAYCPRTCASPELYFKFVVCAACLARRLPQRGWETVKPFALSIEPAEFDFEEWFAAQPALAALLPRSEVPRSRRKVIARLCKSASDPAELLEACRTLSESGGGSAGVRTTCDAAADVDMFVIADEETQAREEDTKTPEVEDEQLQAIIDSTLSRLQSTIATPRASDAEPNSEAVSNASNSPLNTKAFLDRLLRSSVADTDARGALKNAEASVKKLDHKQRESVEEVNDSKAVDVVATPVKGDKHTSMAQEATSKEEGVVGNCADSTPAASPLRKKFGRRKRVHTKKIHSSGKLPTSKAAEESFTFAASMDDEVQHETPLSQKSSLQKHLQKLPSVSAVQDSDATTMPIGDQCVVMGTDQGSVVDLEENSNEHHDYIMGNEMPLSMGREESRDFWNSQAEPVAKALKEASLQSHRTGKAVLSDNGEGLGASSCSEVDSTANSGLLPGHQARKVTKSRRHRIIKSSSEESGTRQELSSVSAVQHLGAAMTFNVGQCPGKRTEQDSIGDLEKKTTRHHDAKIDNQKSLMKGRQGHGRHFEDTIETISSSSDDGAAEKNDGQLMRDDITEALSSSSDVEVAGQNGRRSQHDDDDAETQSSLDSESSQDVSPSSSESEASGEHSCRQSASGNSVKKKRAALSPGMRPSGTASTCSGETCNVQERQRKMQSNFPEPEYKKSIFKGHYNVSASRYAKTSGVHSDSEPMSPVNLGKIQCHPAAVLEARDVTSRTVKKAHRSIIVSSSESSDEECSIECPVLQESVSSDEKRSVEHSAQQGAEFSNEECSVEASDVTPRTAKMAHRSRIVSSSESSYEECSIERPVLQESVSSDEERSVEHSAQQGAEFSNEECSVEARDVTPRTAKMAHRSRIVSSSESSDEECSVERPVLQEAVSSDEEHNIEHSVQQGAKFSNEECCVEHSAQEAESSDEERNVEHPAQQEAKSSDKEHGVEYLPNQESYSSNEKCNIEHSMQQEAESSNDECDDEHLSQSKVRQPAVFSELADEIPCGQRSPGALSLQDMHISPSESDEDGPLFPGLNGTPLAAESDEGVAFGRQHAGSLSQATTVAASSQRRSPSPFSKLRELVMSFQEDSDDETDTMALGGKEASLVGKHCLSKVPLVKKVGTPTTQQSVKLKPQGVRHNVDERRSPKKSQPAHRRACSRSSVSLQREQAAVPDKEQASETDSYKAAVATNATASVSLNSDTMGSRHMSMEKIKVLSPGMKQAGICKNSSGASLPKNKLLKPSKVTKTSDSESEQNDASESDSDEDQRNANTALKSGKCTTQGPSKTEELAKVEASPSNRRKRAPCPNLLPLDPTRPKRATLMLSSDHDFDAASVNVVKESACSEHSRQNEVNARQLQEAESEASAQRKSTRSCAKRLPFGQQKEQVHNSDSGNTFKDLCDQPVPSSDLAKSPSKGKQKHGDPGDGNSSAPEKPHTPAKPSSSCVTHGIEVSGRRDNLSDDGIKCDVSHKCTCPVSLMKKPSSMTKQRSGIEAEATSRSRQLASSSLHICTLSPIRGRTPSCEVQQTGQAEFGVLTRSARRQLSFANGKASLSQKRITMSAEGLGPDVNSNAMSCGKTLNDVEPAPLQVKRRALQGSTSDGHSVMRSDTSPTQAKDNAISEKELEKRDKRAGSASSRHNTLSPSPRLTKLPIVKLDRMQNNETGPLATVSGNNLLRTRSVSASLQGREADASNTTFDGLITSKGRQVGSDMGDTAALARSPLRTASKRRRVVDACMKSTSALDTFEDDSSKTSVCLSGLTQVPLSRNPHASDDSTSSDQEGGDFVHSAQQRRLSLRRLPSRRLPQRNKKEDFIIDVDKEVRSLSDSDDDDDPTYEVSDVNLDASIARLRRLKVPLYTPEMEAQSRTSSAASSYKVANSSAKRTGRLSLAAIRASQSDRSPSSQSSLSPPFSPVATVSSGIPEAQSPASNSCLCHSPSRHAKSYDKQNSMMSGRQAIKNGQSSSENKDHVLSVLEDPQVLSTTNTGKSPEKMPVLRRSTRLSTKQDMPAFLTCSNHLKSGELVAPPHSSHLNKDFEVIVREQTVRTSKRNKSLKMSPSLQMHVKHPDERSGAAEEASVIDDASSSVCSTCNRCGKAASTQDSGTMTDDSYLHDEDAFSDSLRYSKRKKVGSSASASHSKARASTSSCRHGSATQEASVPIRRSSRATAGALRRLSYA
ncbi:serine-rich adhesin for platelets-like [Dermacentor albipictus]|uniref:serine-rich adhesin for platelets-like n=1 Tax=Dermacentor albipictus TaxID=60249 RepID=UPI0031FBCBB4